MSAGKLASRAGWVGKTLAKLVVGWLIIVPIVWALPRRQDWVAVIGKHGGKFIDNGKYFFLQGAPLLAPQNRCVFVTDRRDTSNMLADLEHDVYFFPSLRSIWFLARAGCVVFESAGWSSLMRGYLLIRARKIQLWHGVGFKSLNQWGKWTNEQAQSIKEVSLAKRLNGLRRRLGGQAHNYDLFNTTSVFYRDQVFKPVFEAKHFIITGYPRNAFENFNRPLSDPIWKNVDPGIAQCLEQWNSQETRLVLVAPTLRTDDSAPLDLGGDLVNMLDEFGARENVVFLFKFHPANEGLPRIQRQNIHIIDPNSDIYPIMPRCSALVTDYSSIYMDFLLLDKPVHFYTPDQYENGEGVGEFQFSLESMIPGPQHKSWCALLYSLLDQWRADGYADERSRIRRLAFDDLPQEQSVPELTAYMREQGWIVSGGISLH